MYLKGTFMTTYHLYLNPAVIRPTTLGNIGNSYTGNIGNSYTAYSKVYYNVPIGTTSTLNSFSLYIYLWYYYYYYYLYYLLY